MLLKISPILFVEKETTFIFLFLNSSTGKFIPSFTITKSGFSPIIFSMEGLEQMISQIDKLEDVVKVQRNQSDPTMFNKIAVFFQ